MRPFFFHSCVAKTRASSNFLEQPHDALELALLRGR
jgi:hypothetical protein